MQRSHPARIAPQHRPLARRLVACVLTLFSCVAPVLAGTGGRPPQPTVRVSLDALGYQPLQSSALLSGSSMMTVNFVDASHLLITFALRRLLVREPDTPNDLDRTIGAFLVELPSGKVVAQTEWRVHDMGQYLWSIGHGRFLLRIRDQLTMIEPMRADPDDRFRQQAFLNVKRQIVAMMVSPDNDLLTIETADAPATSDLAGLEQARSPAPIQINFYRLMESGDAGTKLTVAFAGVLRAHQAIALPVDAAGFLDIVDDGKNRFGFNFDTHAGKVTELAGIESSCFPRPFWVSPTEFIAFGCRGSDDRQEIEGFNLKGEALWQFGLSDSFVATNFEFAPAAGRFVMERLLVAGNFDSSFPLSSEQVNSEEIRVFQTYNGRQIFRIDGSPAQRAGQNFDISPDGEQLAVYRDTTQHIAATKDTEAYTDHAVAVEVYALPQLTKEDLAAVQAAHDRTPPQETAIIQLGTPAKAPDSASASTGKSALTVTPPLSSSASQPASTSEPAANASTAQGDAEPSAPRKPPSLYGPDETPPSKPQ